MLTFSDLISMLRWFIVAGFLLTVFVIWKSNKNTKRRVIGVLVFVAVLGAWFTWLRYPEVQRAKAYKARYAAAEAIFDERCKTAGEKIYKTVDDVEGIFLLNVRPKQSEADKHDPDWANAALPKEPAEDEYIETFLHRVNRGGLSLNPADYPGYRYVDVEVEGQLWRYTLRQRGEKGFPRPKRQEIASSPTRYGVLFENMVNPNDRQHWIAGTTVKVIDMKTSEVLAEATWYAFEHGFGSNAGARVPWSNSLTCPQQTSYSVTRFFVDKVVRPKK